jgi:hypothetical protein
LQQERIPNSLHVLVDSSNIQLHILIGLIN